MLYSEDSRTRKTRTIEHTRTLEYLLSNPRIPPLQSSNALQPANAFQPLNASNALQPSSLILQQMLSSPRIHKPLNSRAPQTLELQLSNALELTNPRTHELLMLSIHLFKLANLQILYKWMEQPGNGPEEATNGQRRLRIDRRGYKCIEEAANGRS